VRNRPHCGARRGFNPKPGVIASAPARILPISREFPLRAGGRCAEG